MTKNKQALIPRLVELNDEAWKWNLVAIAAGVFLIACLAQISIPLSWTPVPITGQTFAVALVSLLWGRKLAFATVGSYLLLGSAGLPLFAMGKSGIVIGPTSGYLVGMWMASYVMGSLADHGFSRGFFTAWFAAVAGSAIIFTCGLIGLSFFVPIPQVFILGLLPFLPGDLVKTCLAAWFVSRSRFFSNQDPEPMR